MSNVAAYPPDSELRFVARLTLSTTTPNPIAAGAFDSAGVEVFFPLTGSQAFRVVGVDASIFMLAAPALGIIPVQFGIQVLDPTGVVPIINKPSEATMGLSLGANGLLAHLDSDVLYYADDYLSLLPKGLMGNVGIVAEADINNTLGAIVVQMQLAALVEIFERKVK